jgi:FAD/FMN-containing dehydrogenase
LAVRPPRTRLARSNPARSVYGGTLSGEHGIGLLKKQFMELDVGTDALDLMRAIKDAVDPRGDLPPLAR